jgi:hypothetical protein
MSLHLQFLYMIAVTLDHWVVSFVCVLIFFYLSGRRLYYFTWPLSADIGDRHRYFTAFLLRASAILVGQGRTPVYLGTVQCSSGCSFMCFTVKDYAVFTVKDYAVTRNVAGTIADLQQLSTLS